MKISKLSKCKNSVNTVYFRNVYNFFYIAELNFVNNVTLL